MRKTLYSLILVLAFVHFSHQLRAQDAQDRYKTQLHTTWKVNANQPPRRQDRQEKDREKAAVENEKPTL
jgi:hypothetical protein